MPRWCSPSSARAATSRPPGSPRAVRRCSSTGSSRGDPPSASRSCWCTRAPTSPAVVLADRVETAWRPGTGEHDQFEIASVTKLLTTLAALAAVETGRVDLDQRVPLGRWAPAGDDEPTTP